MVGSEPLGSGPEELKQVSVEDWGDESAEQAWVSVREHESARELEYESLRELEHERLLDAATKAKVVIAVLGMVLGGFLPRSVTVHWYGRGFDWTHLLITGAILAVIFMPSRLMVRVLSTMRYGR